MEYTDNDYMDHEKVENPISYYDEYHEMLADDMTLRSYISTVSFFLVFINIAVLVSAAIVVKSERDTTSIYLLFGNLSSVDCIYNVFVYYIALRFEKIDADKIDYVFAAMNVCGTVSHLTIVLITLNRYLYILYGLHYEKWLSASFNIKLFVAAWFVGLTVLGIKYLNFVLNILFTSPFVCVCLIYRTLKKRFRSMRSNATNESNLNTNNQLMQNMNNVTSNNVVEHEEEEEESHPSSSSEREPPSGFWDGCFLDGGKRIRSEKMKSLKILTCLVLIFSVHRLPYAAWYIAHCLTDCNQSPESCHRYASLMGKFYTVSVFSKAANPIVYAVWHRFNYITMQNPVIN